MSFRLVHLLPPFLALIAPGIFAAKVDAKNTYGQSTAQMDWNHKCPAHLHLCPHCHPLRLCHTHRIPTNSMNGLQVRQRLTLLSRRLHLPLLHVEDLIILMSTWTSNIPILIKTRRRLKNHLVPLTLAKNLIILMSTWTSNILILIKTRRRLKNHLVPLTLAKNRAETHHLGMTSMFPALRVSPAHITLSSMVSRAFFVCYIYVN
jgi:hypothetical protein